jgi:hypothetical protein
VTDALVETLRLRGSAAARLARVAATALPGALDRALAGLPDARIDGVTVHLDLDLADYDDATLATLWADAIRAQVVRHVGATRGLPDATAGHTKESPSAPVTREDAVGAARSWLAQAEPRGPVPREALALAKLVPRDGPTHSDEEARAILLALDAALARPRRAAQPPRRTRPPAEMEAAPPDVPPREGAAPTGSSTRDLATPPPSAETPTRDAVHDSSDGHIANDQPLVAAALARITAVADVAADQPVGIDLDSVTAAAGLALLYPWLADHCRTAMELHPGLDDAAVRAHALAAIVDPGDPSLLEDPLVLCLAGALAPLRDQAELPRAREVADSAEAVLTSFATLLPGFAESSAEFVRGEWIRRVGLLDTVADPVRLTAATHPLDVVLSRLPYPLGLFKLPWSPPVMVRFRP